MSIDIRAEDELAPDTWDSLVQRAEYTDAMHQWATLDVLAEYSNCTVHRLVGYKGQEPVGVFPVFARRYGPFAAAFSPPPSLRIVYLGPGLLNMDKLKQRKTDRRQRRFVDGVFEWIESNLGPEYLHVRTGPGYPDVRPFTWNGCRVSPTYTYHVDITGSESELLGRFSRDARSNIESAADTEYEIVERGPEAIDRILEQVRSRYESQGIEYGVPTSFVQDLYERSPDGTVRPYTCRVEGEFVGGIVAFEFRDSISRWQGGVRPEASTDLPVNDLLDWALIQAGRERGLETYDLVGADNPRINKYKSKFGPDLAQYYSIERGTALGTLASRLYKRVK